MNKLMNKRKMWLFPLFFIGIFLAASGLVMFLWNSILPTLFSGVGLLSFSHAMGLLVLCRLLFGSFKGPGNNRNHNGRHWKEKLGNMTDEEKEKFKSEWKNRCMNR